MAISLPFLYYTALVLLCVLTLYFLAQAIYPKLTWMIKRWQYQYPDQVRPSKWIFLLRRIRALIFVCVLTALTVKLFLARDTLLDLFSVVHSL